MFSYIHIRWVMSPPRDHILLNLVIYCDIQLPNDNRMRFNGISSFAFLLLSTHSHAFTLILPPIPIERDPSAAHHRSAARAKNRAIFYLFAADLAKYYNIPVESAQIVAFLEYHLVFRGSLRLACMWRLFPLITFLTPHLKHSRV